MTTSMAALLRAVFPGRRGAWAEHAIHDLHRLEDFRRVLQRERALGDRGGHPFTVIVLVAPDRRPATLDLMLHYLDQRVRTTDELGSLGASRVGLLLRGTDGVGARKLVALLAAGLAAQHCVPICRVTTNAPEESSLLAPPDDPRQRDFTDLRPGWLREDDEPGAGIPAGPAAGMAVAAARVEDDAGAGLRTDLLAPPVPVWKRATDVSVALAAMMALAPVMLLLALHIKLASPGPVFFRQERIGHLGRPFVCWKFRTMHVTTDADVHRRHVQALMQSGAPLRKIEQGRDNRLIPLARLIRAGGLDELPQLINVLKQDMSLIGPRPCLRYEYEQFASWHKQRFDTRPGLTGLWQVSGKNRTTFQEMMRLDIRYGRRATWLRDLAILLKTIPVVGLELARVVQGRLRDSRAADMGRATA